MIHYKEGDIMFSTSDVVTVTQAAIAQITASGYMGLEDYSLDALDTQHIVDLGEKLGLDPETGNFTLDSAPDIFFKALLTQVGKIITDNRSYTANLPNLFVDPVNWGLMTEHIMIELSDVMIDEMWNPNGFIPWNAPESGGVYPGHEEGKRIAAIEFGCYKPPVSATIYKKAHGIMVALTTAREQFFTAFRNADEYAAFLAGLYNSVENTLQVKAEIYGLMTLSMGIAKSTANGNVINLRDEYIAIGGDSSLTGADLINNPGFQRYALQRISDVRDYVRRMTDAFNNHEHVTFSADTSVVLLSQFANAAKFGVRANTYNEELLGIGDYDRTPTWQAVVSSSSTTPYDIETASTISLTAAAATAAGLDPGEEDSYTISGVIGVLYDRYAMGITLDKRKVTTQYSASRDTVNSFYHSLINYVVNDNYPIVSFTIAVTEP